MLKIFLAHAKEDETAVIDLYNRLKQKGYNPWLDKEDLLPGQNWRQEIPKAIQKSQVFIACLSQRSISKDGYVQSEFRIALNVYAKKPQGSIYLIPLRLDNCPMLELGREDYGIDFRDIQCVDLFKENGFERLLKALEHGFPDEHKHQEVLASSTIVDVIHTNKLPTEEIISSTKVLDGADKETTGLTEAIKPGLKIQQRAEDLLIRKFKPFTINLSRQVARIDLDIYKENVGYVATKLAHGVKLLIVTSVSITGGAIVLLILISSFSQIPTLVHSPSKSDSPSQEEPKNSKPPSLSQPVSILMLGNSQNDSLSEVFDLWLLARLDPIEKRLVILSIPGNTRTNVNGLVTKISDASAENPAVPSLTVSELTGGLEIKGYIDFNNINIVDAVDYVGGVRLNILDSVSLRSESPGGTPLTAGTQTLNSIQVAEVIKRNRLAPKNMQLIDVQNRIVFSLIKALSKQTRSDDSGETISFLNANTSTDMSNEVIEALLYFVEQLDYSDIYILKLPGEPSKEEDYEEDFWIPSYSEIDRIAEQYFGLAPLPEFE
ncbi:MAG: TIR domain-containing protein [Cyanobacteria bacterium J06600_6]